MRSEDRTMSVFDGATKGKTAFKQKALMMM